MSDRLCRTLTPEIKVVSTAEATVDYIASDQAIDCYNEIIVAKGWRFTRFSKNSPFVDSHEYGCIDKLLGNVTSFEVKGQQLIERVKWAVNANPLAQLGFNLTRDGFLKAVSVGFMEVSRVWQGTKEFVDAVTKLKLTPEQAAQVRCIHLEQEQIELSACIIGANPNALAKAFKAGALKEADLASIGFSGDSEFEFLQRAGALYDELEPLQALQVRMEMSRIYRSRSLSPQSNQKQPHQAPDGDAAAKRQAEQQREEMLHALSQKLAAVPLA